MAKWCDQGENAVAEDFFNNSPAGGYSNLYLGLYKNTTEPPENATLSDIVEPSDTGYSRIALAQGNWTVTNDTAEYAQQTFTFTNNPGGETIYGYFIATSSDNTGKLLAVEHFSNPFTIQNNGDQIKITVRVTVA